MWEFFSSTLWPLLVFSVTGTENLKVYQFRTSGFTQNTLNSYLNQNWNLICVCWSIQSILGRKRKTNPKNLMVIVRSSWDLCMLLHLPKWCLQKILLVLMCEWLKYFINLIFLLSGILIKLQHGFHNSMGRSYSLRQ